MTARSFSATFLASKVRGRQRIASWRKSYTGSLILFALLFAEICQHSRRLSFLVRTNSNESTLQRRLSVLVRTDGNKSTLQRRLSANKEKEKPLRILYIVTSLAEFNTGRRFTTRGDDRFQKFMLPVVLEGVESMLSFGYHVDVYFILHWKMSPQRLKLARDSLPQSVGLDVWDDATPLGYKRETDHNHTDPVTRGLARQHRYVIKDKLLEYDLFVNFEDDMLIKGDHVQEYLRMTKQLAALREAAPTTRFVPRNLSTPMSDIFYGPLQKVQIDRLVPGLMRVEVLRDESKHGAQQELDPIPVDLEFDGVHRTVDPQPCCHVSNKTAAAAIHIPATPTADKVFIWETGIKGLSVREIDGLGWVMLQSGSFMPNRNRCIGNYWSGRDGHFGDASRPIVMDPVYLNNQGGWMATREQILEWHMHQCPCGFLPPYDEPCFPYDGLDLRNVEYWSGGMHLFQSFRACNLQRIIPLEPDQWSKHLIYHSANNKQRQLKQRGKQYRFVKVDNLLGQLNTVKKNAEIAKKKELEAPIS